MAHTCKDLLVNCKDFRIQKKMMECLLENNLTGDCDHVSPAGGIKNIDYVLAEIESSLYLHAITEVIISNHTDCGAYESAGPFSSFEEECNFHIEEMKKARDLILAKFPSLKLRMVLGKILPDDKVELEEIN